MTAYLQRHLRYLAAPQTHKPLISFGESITPNEGDDIYYPIVDGVYQFMKHDPSVDFDKTCDQRGWSAPSVAEFMALPHEGLRGWGANYWRQRGLSTAGMWHVLEQFRRDAKRRPAGFQGVAAHITTGLPYVAYGLDLGGYATYAVSPHRGAYSLGVYSTGRFARVQATLDALPLKPDSFDVIVYSAVLPTDAPTDSQIEQMLMSLKRRGGMLFLLDVADAVGRYKKLLRRHALRVESLDLRMMEDSVTPRVSALLGRRGAMPPLLVAKWA